MLAGVAKVNCTGLPSTSVTFRHSPLQGTRVVSVFTALGGVGISRVTPLSLPQSGWPGLARAWASNPPAKRPPPLTGSAGVLTCL